MNYTPRVTAKAILSLLACCGVIGYEVVAVIEATKLNLIPKHCLNIQCVKFRHYKIVHVRQLI